MCVDQVYGDHISISSSSAVCVCDVYFMSSVSMSEPSTCTVGCIVLYSMGFIGINSMRYVLRVSQWVSVFLCPVQRSDTPLSERTHSRSDSMASYDSLDSFRLTTTFIRHITPGSMAEEAGLEEGLAVQQIDGESILRSSGEEIQHLLEQWWVASDQWSVK